MSWFSGLFGRSDAVTRQRERARSLVRRASKNKDRKNYAAARNQIQEALQHLSDLPTPDDRQLRALCYIALAETTLYVEARATHPPLSMQTATDCLTFCEKAEVELLPLQLPAESTFNEWLGWYVDSPTGLIELYRGAALHFSSRATDDQREQAIDHYQRSVKLLGKFSEHGKTARELLSDALESESAAQQIQDLPTPPTEVQAFLHSLSSAMAKVELERQNHHDN